MDMIGKISSERRLRRIFWIVHNLFINDRQDASDERQD